MVVIAAGTYLCSRFIPRAEATDPNLKVNFNLFTATWDVIRFASQTRSIFLSLLGISWFWLVGALILAQLPAYAKDVLGGDKTVFTLLLAAFSIGTALGSLACERLSGHKIEIGLVPLGSIGMTVCLIDLYFEHPDAHASGARAAVMEAVSIRRRLGRGAGLRADRRVRWFVHRAAVRADSVAQRGKSSRPHHRLQQHPQCRLHGAGRRRWPSPGSRWAFSIPQLFILAGVLNALVATYIYTLVPEFLMRFLTWVFVNMMYRIKVRGLENIPETGPALLVSNHVSFMDALVIGGSVRRPVRFVMDHSIFKIPILGFIFRTARAIPIAPAREDPDALQQGLRSHRRRARRRRSGLHLSRGQAHARRRDE